MKAFLIKVKEFFKKIAPSKRRLIQLYSALLFNANVKGFVTGQIYTGPLKNVCTPGLNCYSCPGASTSCPLGAMQNALSSHKARAPYYVIGIILLYCIIFGRWICGFLCPFGLLQDLVYKIKTPKIKKNKVTRALTYLKYVILVLFVIVLPIAYAFRDFPLPAFCKYICPAGTLGGAIGLLINPFNVDMLSMLGPLFTWKFIVAIAIIILSIFIYRAFCRFICPLGALYSLFNKIAICGVTIDKPSCTNCGKCVTFCKMDIKSVGDRECINCGECISICPTQAIRWKGSKILLPANEITPISAPIKDETDAKPIDKYSKMVNAVIEYEKPVKAPKLPIKSTAKPKNIKLLVVQIITVVLMIALLTSACVYYNYIDYVPVEDDTPDDTPSTPSTPSTPTAPVLGNKVGDICFSLDLQSILNKTMISIEDFRGKKVIINFWGTWCSACVKELPDFDRIATEFADEVVVYAVHSVYQTESPKTYINKNYSDSKIVWVRDVESTSNKSDDEYYIKLGGKNGTYPMTVIIDEEGIITFTKIGSMHYEDLLSEISK